MPNVHENLENLAKDLDVAPESLLDSKGRLYPEVMSDSDMLREILETMRGVADALEELGQNPMLRAMIPGGLRI